MEMNAFQVLMGKPKRLTAFKSKQEDKKRRLNNKPSCNKKGLVQMCLDVGQKSLGKQKTCRDCGMMYVIGQEDDEVQHKKFCKKTSCGIPFRRKWKSERVLMSNFQNDDRVIEIPTDGSHAHQTKLKQIKVVMDESLGFVPDDVFFNSRVFIFIKDRRVAACIVAESIQFARPVVDLEAENLICSAEKRKAIVGVRQLWVDPAFRRQKLATQLLDEIRKAFVYGMLVKKDLVAFSQPTRLGKAFAERYLHPNPLLVYNNDAIVR